jgi:hypothetical protein
MDLQAFAGEDQEFRAQEAAFASIQFSLPLAAFLSTQP